MSHTRSRSAIASCSRCRSQSTSMFAAGSRSSSRAAIRLCGLNMKVPNRAPSSPSRLTSPPGGICRYSGFIAISLENTQGAPARSRRP